jgi:diguanylate cyclase (GGDEF)-like protein
LIDRLKSWRQRHSNAVFSLYAVLLFALAVGSLLRASNAGEFVLQGASGIGFAVGSYALAIFIILLGFTTPRFAYVSLDRITQVGLVLVLSPADAALINGLASFTYPLIAQRRQYGFGMALVRSFHNSAMFSLMIYWAGLAYLAVGGAIPVMVLDGTTVMAFALLIFSMQAINSIFLHIRAVVMAVPRSFAPDWYSHAIEVPVAIVGLLTALIYNQMSAPVFALFLLMLISVIVIAKFLNEVTIALKRRIKQLVTVNRIAKAISSSVQLEHLVHVVYNEVAQALDPSEFYFGVRNADSGQLVFHHKRGDAAAGKLPGPGALRLMHYCMEHVLPLHLASLQDSRSSYDHMLEPSQRAGGSLVCLPIVYNHEVLGIIYVASLTELAINHDHYKLMQAISRQVSTAIKNINLIAHLEERKETLEQKVFERVAEIEHQKRALTAMNATLEQANLRQEELLVSLRSASAELERQNREDALTGLYNRRHMDEFLAREYERSQRQSSPLSVALIDVDHFKSVNDNFSHQIGDATLQALGVIIPDAVRALDLVARYGGEEILLCMPDTALEDAVAVCERARAAIAAYDWESVAPGLKITASFGVSQGTQRGVADLLAHCDERLYQAKHAGRNQVCA